MHVQHMYVACTHKDTMPVPVSATIASTPAQQQVEHLQALKPDVCCAYTSQTNQLSQATALDQAFSFLKSPFMLLLFLRSTDEPPWLLPCCDALSLSSAAP